MERGVEHRLVVEHRLGHGGSVKEWGVGEDGSRDEWRRLIVGADCGGR